MVLAVATVFDIVGVRALLFTQQASELSAAEGEGGKGCYFRSPSRKINSTKFKRHTENLRETHYRFSHIYTHLFSQEYNFSILMRSVGQQCSTPS